MAPQGVPVVPVKPSGGDKDPVTDPVSTKPSQPVSTQPSKPGGDKDPVSDPVATKSSKPTQPSKSAGDKDPEPEDPKVYDAFVLRVSEWSSSTDILGRGIVQSKALGVTDPDRMTLSQLRKVLAQYTKM